MEAGVQTLLFWFFAILGIGGGVGLIFNRNPVYSALCLILNFFSISGLYLSLSAEFLAAIQVLVYAGAIMVLFLFVIMLLNLSEEKGILDITPTRLLSLLLGIALVVELLYVFREFADDSVKGAFQYGKVEPLGQMLMTEYLFPFEMISVILLSALIGAILIARKYSYSED
ncbi:MAG: NADH-quinone oxidoreductase subunit J [Bacteroidota bacterium]